MMQNGRIRRCGEYPLVQDTVSVIKAYGFILTFGEAYIYKKVSGSSVAFLILYVDDILLIGMI